MPLPRGPVRADPSGCGNGEETEVRSARDDRAVERGGRRFQRAQVEVVRRLVERHQQHGPAQFEQQDLEPRLLTAGQALERLLGLRHDSVAAEHAAGALVVEARALRDAELWYGDLVAVLGSAASGKSHLLRLLASSR